MLDTVVAICLEGSFPSRLVGKKAVIFLLFAKWKIDGISLSVKQTFDNFQANRIDISQGGVGVAA